MESDVLAEIHGIVDHETVFEAQDHLVEACEAESILSDYTLYAQFLQENNSLMTFHSIENPTQLTVQNQRVGHPPAVGAIYDTKSLSL